MRVLCLDIGSSSVKAGVWEAGRRQTLGRIRIAYPTKLQGEKAEVDASALLRVFCRAGRAAIEIAPAGNFDAVCFCAFSSGVVVTDAAGTPRTPVITHADRRSVDAASRLVRARGKAWWLHHTTNLPYPGGIGSSTLAWLRRHSPGIFRGKYRAGQFSSLVGRMLTGEWISDPSQAVFLGLWDIHRHAWSTEACRAVGIEPSAFPRVQWADEPLGHLSASLARSWKITPGIPVLGGFVDTSAAVIQTPMAAGQLAHNTGSTDVLAICLDQPRPAEGILTRPVGVGCSYPQKWLAVRTIASSGSALQWARQTFFREFDDRAWSRAMASACKAALTQLPSQSAQCSPNFAGEHVVLEQTPGAAFSNLHLGTSREDLLRALVDSLAGRSAQDYDRLRILHTPRRKVFAMGGASILADLMHQKWPGAHEFMRLAGDSLAGLGQLAHKALTAR